MAVSMGSDPESEQELAESCHLMLKNDCLCFRMSSSFVGNNQSPSLQIHSFSEDRGKCNNIWILDKLRLNDIVVLCYDILIY